MNGKRLLLTGALLLAMLFGCEREKPGPPSAKDTTAEGKRDAAKGDVTVKHRGLTLSFPNAPLQNGERIIGFEITVTSGSVRSINNIPRGWSVRLDNELSWKPVLSGKIHHGVEALAGPGELQSLLVIEPDPPGEGVPPFHVEAKLFMTVNFESTTTRSFPMSQLLLTPGG